MGAGDTVATVPMTEPPAPASMDIRRNQSAPQRRDVGLLSCGAGRVRHNNRVVEPKEGEVPIGLRGEAEGEHIAWQQHDWARAVVHSAGGAGKGQDLLTPTKKG